jgi:hypothetical protein
VPQVRFRELAEQDLGKDGGRRKSLVEVVEDTRRRSAGGEKV